MGFDDGLRVSLLIKNKEDEKPSLGDPNKYRFMNSGDTEKISNTYNRGNVVLNSREDEIKRSKERQKLIDEILAKAGLV